MLGSSCSPCCDTCASQCECSVLPNEFTLRISDNSGFPNSLLTLTQDTSSPYYTEFTRQTGIVLAGTSGKAYRYYYEDSAALAFWQNNPRFTAACSNNPTPFIVTEEAILYVYDRPRFAWHPTVQAINVLNGRSIPLGSSVGPCGCYYFVLYYTMTRWRRRTISGTSNPILCEFTYDRINTLTNDASGVRNPFTRFPDFFDEFAPPFRTGYYPAGFVPAGRCVGYGIVSASSVSDTTNLVGFQVSDAGATVGTNGRLSLVGFA